MSNFKKNDEWNDWLDNTSSSKIMAIKLIIELLNERVGVKGYIDDVNKMFGHPYIKELYSKKQYKALQDGVRAGIVATLLQIHSITEEDLENFNK